MEYAVNSIVGSGVTRIITAFSQFRGGHQLNRKVLVEIVESFKAWLDLLFPIGNQTVSETSAS